MVPGGGVEPPRYQVPADFESYLPILEPTETEHSKGAFLRAPRLFGEVWLGLVMAGPSDFRQRNELQEATVGLQIAGL